MPLNLNPVGGIPQTLNFMPSTDEWAHAPNHKPARDAIELIMMGWNAELVKHNNFFTTIQNLIFGIPNERRLISRNIYQKGFKQIHQQLMDMERSGGLTPEANAQIEFYISNCLSYFSFCELNPYEFISVPQRIDDQWVLVDYKIKPIELTPKYGFETLFIRESDRLFAYGLEAISNDKAVPHLVFMGTAIGGGQGLISQLHTDFEPFETPGKRIYRYGLQEITAFLDKQMALDKNKKTHVCGMSLGGALSLLVAIHQGEKVSRVDALNPPGLHKPFFRKSQYDKWDELVETDQAPIVYIQKQSNDEISSYGNWKNEFKIYHVKPPQAYQPPDNFYDHTLNYAGLAGTEFTLVDTTLDNQQRQLRNWVMFIGVRFMMYLFLVFPTYFFIRPLAFLVMRHFLEIIVVASFLSLMPVLTGPLLIIFGGFAVFSGMIILSDIAFDLMQSFCSLFSIDAIHLHVEDALRAPSMDLYAFEDEIEIEKSTLKAYYKHCSIFSPKVLEEVDDEHIRIRDTKARIYVLKQIERLNHVESLSEIEFDKRCTEVHKDYIKGKFICP